MPRLMIQSGSNQREMRATHPFLTGLLEIKALTGLTEDMRMLLVVGTEKRGPIGI